MGIFGCHKGECDFETGNLHAERHVNAVKFMLEKAGISPDRVGMYFMSAAEIDKFLKAVNDLSTKVSKLPENPLKKDPSRNLTINI